MAFRFKLAEPFEDGCRRIAREQIERAQCQLKGKGDPVVAVHETRKCLKRLRALLRLVRPALGEPAFHAENAQLREIGRGLSGTRDRHVLLETVTKLDASASTARKGLVQAMREVLHFTNGGEAPSVDAAAVRQAQGRLAEAKKRLARLRVSGHGFDVVGPGLEASYRKARRAFHAAYVEQTDEAFHEWRKGTQQHWRHMLLLSRAWPECLDGRVNDARGLSQLLGDDHDLTLLIAFVHSDPAAPIGSERAAAIEKLARRRQQELRTIAHPTGLRLFSEGAKSLRRRMAAYWEAAVELKENESQEEEEEEAKAPKAPKAVPKAARRQPARRSRPAAVRP